MKPIYFITSLLFITFSSLCCALDTIPEDLSKWEEKGTILESDPNLFWENKLKIGIAGSAKVGTTYYLFYLAGFNGQWKEHGGSNHQSLGVATSQDGITFKKHTNNPVLTPHVFVPVSAEEEGIRTAFVQYVPSEKQFYGFFGVESPGGKNTCPFRDGALGWISWFCKGNIEVDSAVYLATSFDGLNWDVKGAVDGAYRKKGHEVYASGWVHDGTKFHLYITTAEGGLNKKASSGDKPLNLKELGEAKELQWGWSGINTFLHDDNNTVTLIYDPKGGKHPGTENEHLYFATTTLDDMTVIQNERAIPGTKGVQSKHAILKDDHEWKWYYILEDDQNRHQIKLRVHTLTP